MQREVFQLGEARMLEEPAILILKSSEMMTGLGWRMSIAGPKSSMNERW